MVVYVDNPRRYKKRGKRWAHLFSDSADLAELHAFAKKLNLKRQWYDGKRWPHYDITPGQAMFALKHGAQFAGRLRMIQVAKPAAYERITGRKVTLVYKNELTKESEKGSISKSTEES